MSPSKFSPAERIIRKREANRIRQQRCRERKKQVKLNKLLEEQMRKQTAACCEEVKKTTKFSRQVTSDEQVNVVPHSSIFRTSYNLSERLDTCDSLPSLGSESSTSEVNSNVICVPSSPSLISAGVNGSPRVISNITHQGRYSPRTNEVSNLSRQACYSPQRSQYYQSPLPSTFLPSPIDESIFGGSRMAMGNNELDAVSAMLSLQFDAITERRGLTPALTLGCRVQMTNLNGIYQDYLAADRRRQMLSMLMNQQAMQTYVGLMQGGGSTSF